MSTWTKATKNIATYTKQAISGFLGIFTSESGIQYLVGQDADKILVFSLPVDWTKQTKN
jgi:hypothetical protein